MAWPAPVPAGSLDVQTMFEVLEAMVAKDLVCSYFLDTGQSAIEMDSIHFQATYRYDLTIVANLQRPPSSRHGYLGCVYVRDETFLSSLSLSPVLPHAER